MSEQLVYVRMDKDRGDLIVQLDGGGAMRSFRRGMPVEQVVEHLRSLAHDLELGAHRRRKTAPPPDQPLQLPGR